MSINNLTDARYFAAAGCDWIGFDMSAGSPLTVEHVNAFVDWVEGPRAFIDVRGRSRSDIETLIIQLEPEGLLYADQRPEQFNGYGIGQWPAQDVEAVIISRAEDLTEVNGNERWFVFNETSDLKELSSHIDGLVIRGGSEEKIGLKNYDEIDVLVEMAQNYLEAAD